MVDFSDFLAVPAAVTTDLGRNALNIVSPYWWMNGGKYGTGMGDQLQDYAYSKPESAMGQDARWLTKSLVPRTYMPAIDRFKQAAIDYATKPAQAAGGAAPTAGPTGQDLLALGRPAQQGNIGDYIKKMLSDRADGQVYKVPPQRSFSEMLPQPSAPVGPDFSRAKPPQATTDFGPARQWMEQAQPKPEQVDPSVMMLSVLGGLASGAQGSRTIAQALAGAGGGGAQGALQGKNYEQGIARRNEAARTGYARERGGFEMDVGRASSGEKFRNEQSVYGHEMDIGKTAADLANKAQERQYQYQRDKAQLDIATAKANEPSFTIHNGHAIQTTRDKDGSLVYTVTPQTDPNASLIKLMYLRQAGALGGGLDGGGGGSGSGGAGKEPLAVSVDKNIRAGTEQQSEARGGQAMQDAAAWARAAALQSEVLENSKDPTVQALHAKILAEDPGLKLLRAKLSGSSDLNDIALYKQRLAEAYQRRIAASPDILKILIPTLRQGNG